MEQTPGTYHRSSLASVFVLIYRCGKRKFWLHWYYLKSPILSGWRCVCECVCVCVCVCVCLCVCVCVSNLLGLLCFWIVFFQVCLRTPSLINACATHEASPVVHCSRYFEGCKGGLFQQTCCSLLQRELSCHWSFTSDVPSQRCRQCSGWFPSIERERLPMNILLPGFP